tara:strand:- start:182 stop:1177 length:996 start_codon:yes stop_codon:yes gene_type:complete
VIKKPFQINKIQLNENKFYLFYGVNEGQKNDKIYELLSSIDKNNIFKYDEKEILNDERIFFDQILTKSLFNDQKIIIINRATDKIFKILNDVVDKEINDIVIINSSALEKKSKLRNLFEKTNKFVCVAFYEDTNETLIKLASNFFKKNQILISSLDMNLIVNKCAGDRGILYNEMNKIKYYTLKNKKITSEQILKLTNLIENFSIFELVNNCLAKNKKKTLDILTENNFDNSDCIIIIRSFLLRSKKIYELRKSYEKNKDLELTIDNFKPPIFWKEKEITKKQIFNWSIKDLRTLIYRLSQLELLAKKNLDNSVYLITDFIFSESHPKVNN